MCNNEIAWNMMEEDGIYRKTIILEHHKHTESIVIGHTIGTAEYAGHKMTVVGSGKLLRFYVEGIDGHVDVNLNEIASEAAELLIPHSSS